MSDRIETVLVSTLEQARAAASDAEQAVNAATARWKAFQRDVDHLEELLAHHLRQVAAEPPTQAIPAVPPVEAQVAPVPQGVALADIRKGVGYQDSTEEVWVWRGDMCDRDGGGVGQVPLLWRGDDSRAPADFVIAEWGPLVPVPATPDPEITRPDETPDGA